MTQPHLTQLLLSALQQGDREPLEHYLAEHSNLPGPRGNLELLNAFADAVGAVITQPDPPVEQLEDLLDGWAALDVAVSEPRVMLPCAAVLAYGQAGASRPDWWDGEIAKIHSAAADSRWRVREMVAAALQRMLAADWKRAYSALVEWVSEDDPLVIRAAAAGVAEPPLLHEPTHAENTLAIQQRAVEKLAQFPPESRRDENVRTLRQALGYTVSVAVAAAPDAGFRLLERLAASGDSDVRWVVRENLKKNRLKPWSDRVETIRAQL
jgi:hypothetical protein